ncbi:MAG: DUF2877 domain-containing protein [Lachnospiraceae bacterium]|nr:DUF2877 domain-containing protein [Lachnospiraceae bacterium]
MAECRYMCRTLAQQLTKAWIGITLHSSFQSAANFSSPMGMITVLHPGRGLQPYSAVLEQPFSFEQLQDGIWYINSEGISGPGKRVFSFETAQRRNTLLDHRPRWRQNAGLYLLEFLGGHRDQGLTAMAFGDYTDMYQEFLAPRIHALRSAVRSRNEADIVRAAQQMAGCGIGLTPSSDDFLCGYLLGMPELGIPGLKESMAAAAAKKTNDISAALLTRAGQDLFSCDILELTVCLELEVPQERLWKALERVAAFGSSSGCDFLTGLYAGITENNEMEE